MHAGSSSDCKYPHDCARESDIQFKSDRFQSSAGSQHIDNSHVYGFTDRFQRGELRTLNGGRLVSVNNLFPRRANCTGDACYFSGEPRSTATTGLSMWAALMVRYHNAIADGLAAVNGHWLDERLFQEARRIVTAVYQHILYDEWLPLYFGERAMGRRNVSCPAGDDGETLSGCRGRYDPTVDGSTMVEFSTGAFRLLHANTPLAIGLYDEEYRFERSVLYSDLVHGAVILETQYAAITRGFFKDPISIGRYPESVCYLCARAILQLNKPLNYHTGSQ